MKKAILALIVLTSLVSCAPTSVVTNVRYATLTIENQKGEVVWQRSGLVDYTRNQVGEHRSVIRYIEKNGVLTEISYPENYNLIVE